MPNGDGFQVLLASVNLLKECSDWLAPLKAAAAGLYAVLLIVGKHSENTAVMEQLGHRIETIAQIVDMYRGKNDVNLDNSLRALARYIEKTKSDLETHSKRPKLAKIILSDHLGQALAGSSTTLNDIIHDLNLQTLLIIQRNTDHFISDGATSRLRCSDAFYNSNTVSQRGPCAPGTRETVLDELRRWAEDDTSSPIRMLLGRAGYGKTSVAYSFCQNLEKQELLGASFFCSRAAESSTRVSNIIPSICYGLGALYPLVAAILRRSLLEDPDIYFKPLPEQFSKLFLPLTGGLPKRGCPPVIVIEGLDECADDKEVSTLVRLLCGVKLRFKLLLTCRPEQRIRQLIRSLSIPTLNLHDSGTPAVSRDIAIFVRQQLVHIVDGRSDFDEPDPWPSSSDVSRLADLAHGMFLVASAACDYIGGRGGNISKRLQEVISAGLTSTRVVERLDRVYRDILQNAFSLLADDECPAARKVLAAITNLFDSLSVATLDQLLDISEGVRSYLSSFHSILRIGPGNDPLIGIGHDAFREFISDSSRSYQYWLDRRACHEEIVGRCFVLFASLKDNTPATLTVEQISIAVRYACNHWAAHLSLINDPGESTLILLDTFARHHLLIWLACMSRLEGLGHVEKILEDAERWAVAHNMDLLPFFVDARRFTMTHFDRLSSAFYSAHHDALRWSPTESLLRRNYHVPPPTVLSGLPKNWGNCETSVFTNSALTCLASSPDGEVVACGTYDGVIQILDPRTLQVYRSIQGHDDCVRSLEFSRDGFLLVSSSYDSTTRVWDLNLDDLQGLSGHADTVLCAVFSADAGAVITGSADTTIQWWNRSTAVVEKIFRGHSDSVNVVRLTSDDHLLVSASHDSNVRVWNTLNAADVKILRGHSRPVTSLLLLGDTRAISASGDGSIRLWDIVSGDQVQTLFSSQVSPPIDCLAISPSNTHLAVGCKNQVQIYDWGRMHCEKILSGHGDHINALAFLPHGHHMISASDDRTLRTWDLRLPSMEDYAARHSAAVNSFSFADDGNILVSASDDRTIRVWDTNTGECTGVYEQESKVSSASLSWDGSFVVTEGYDHGIRVWDRADGTLIGALQGNSSPQWSIATSPDGCLAASGSQDGRIQIYNIKSGQARHSFAAHQQGINSLAFSGDGQQLVSGSYDLKLKIWSTVDGALKRELDGHTDWVRDATFTHIVQAVVSGSSDKSVRIWSLSQGTHDSLWGHSGGVNSVDVSDDDALIISAGEDRNIFIWDRQEKSVLRQLATHQAAINSISFSLNSTYVAAVSDGMRITVWATEDWEPVMMEDISAPSHFWSVAFSPDGLYVAAGSEDGMVRLWSLETHTLSHELMVEGPILSPIWKVAFAGSNLLTASDDAVVRVWDLDDKSYTTLPGLTLLDGSQLHDGGVKRPIQVVPPVRLTGILDPESGYSLSNDGYCIIDEGGEVCCEIPSTYRDYRVLAWHGSKVALGYGSGLVILIKCD
ncbi:WD40-repeat-containing domain protein [Mycena rosella]|uniref:WD40-repeat-containing domain protein n=1 Tax=Mycena rosella TaxID=1033263 RepID=A0AAD7CRK7_MYCRO|nr:WD40-repeat-containing domain protein [Mycena rosella]